MIRLLLVDDQDLICRGLRATLSLELDFEVVGTAENGLMALEQVHKLKPDVVLMDIRMPVMDGREATKVIVEKFPNVKVLVLSTFDDEEYLEDAIRAGAKGYLLKDMPLEELAQTIRLVDRGYGQMAPGLIDKLMNTKQEANFIASKNNLESLEHLTPREQEILRLIGQGLKNREIAKQSHLSEGTVKTYVSNILDRLELKNRAQLAVFASSIWPIQ
jgi:DNA-binding NarL/FixJ family response regulator